MLTKIRKKIESKEKYEKVKKEKWELDKKSREEKMRRCLTQKDSIYREENEKRLDILDYQNNLINRGMEKDNINDLKRANAGEKTLIEQMMLEQNLANFYKRMGHLKEQSIYRKSQKERYKIYKDLKREEAEKKRKELEEKLEKLRQ